MSHPGDWLLPHCAEMGLTLIDSDSMVHAIHKLSQGLYECLSPRVITGYILYIFLCILHYNVSYHAGFPAWIAFVWQQRPLSHNSKTLSILYLSSQGITFRPKVLVKNWICPC